MVKRDPSRPKAADIDDVLALRVVDECCRTGTYPTDHDELLSYPAKVVLTKLRKAEQRGWILRPGKGSYALTEKGREVLNG